MTEARKHLTEDQFQRQVTDLAGLHGWRWTHFRAARTERGWRTPISGSSGWPDLVLARPPRLLVVELKSDRGPLTPDQLLWLETLRACSVEAYLWRPCDWDEVYETLTRCP